MNDIRVGHGYDVHKLVEGRKLILGGVTVDYHLGLLGHSDADVLIHAICDALLGATCFGDIGQYFPDTDENFKNADSRVLLKKVVKIVKGAGYKISNIDATIIAQKPKLAPYITLMRMYLAEDIEIEISRVNIKATTEEKLGFTGREEGISAHAVCIVAK